MTATWTPDGVEERLYRLDIRETGGASSADVIPAAALAYPLIERIEFEVGHDEDGDACADDIMAARPSTESGFLYWVNYSYGERCEWTLRGDAS